MDTKHGRPLNTVVVYTFREAGCHDLVSLAEAGRLYGCPGCGLFVEIPGDTGPRCCPKCDRWLQTLGEHDIADGTVSPDTHYRVCGHCKFCFFWTDEVPVRDARGLVLVQTTAGTAWVPEAETGGDVFYVCPRCGGATR
jgi:hypothetical protein